MKSEAPNAGSASPADSPVGQDSDVLRRLLEAVEGRQRKRWVEVVCAVVLSLATVGSAWCAYQSRLWSGVQSIRMAESARSGREAAKLTVMALEMRMFDALMLIHFMEAKAGGSVDMQRVLLSRFRPESKPAIDAWLETEPFTNPDAPRSPFQMPQYVQAEAVKSDLHAAEAQRLTAAAEVANENSGRYVLMTVLFASVLFFGGIGGTIDARGLRLLMGTLALTFFFLTTVAMLTLPICHR